MTKKPTKQAIEQAVAARRAWAIEALCGWVEHASVLGNEAGAQDHVAGLMDRLGLRVKKEPIDIDRIRNLPGFSPVDWGYDGRPNVVGVHEPRHTEGRSLIFNGHVDVVSPEPAKLWTSPPFAPRVEQADETRVFGRGAGDMKGGSISYLWALAALRDLGFEPAAPVTFQSVIEEECTGNGTLDLCAKGYRAEACLIPEPFHETVLCHQVGVLWFQVRVLGKTTHVLGAGRGVNAIEKSWQFIEAMHALEEDINRSVRPAPYAAIDHPINLNVGIIDGGDWASTVAGECVTRFRLGSFPGEACEGVMKEIERRVAEVAAHDPWLREFPPKVEYVGFQAEGCSFDGTSDIAQALRNAHAAWRGRPPKDLTATCTTDIRFFNLYYDIPATCYGPAATDIHGVDEWVSLDSMQRVAEVIATLTGDWCGLTER